jgi:hypothetical protein
MEEIRSDAVLEFSVCETFVKNYVHMMTYINVASYG